MAVLKCPVCRARFRGTTDCSRCGADLSPLMRLAGRAWLARQRAIHSLLSGEPHLAAELASEAASIKSSYENHALVTLTKTCSLLSAQDSA